MFTGTMTVLPGNACKSLGRLNVGSGCGKGVVTVTPGGSGGTSDGPLVVVHVGALNVSSISTVAHGEIASGAPREWRETQLRSFPQGDEIGRFNMGSTVIVLTGARAAWRPDATLGAAVRVGEALADVGARRDGRR